MKKETIEHLLTSYYDRLADYLEARLNHDDSDQLRSVYGILLGEELDPSIPPVTAARTIIRNRMAVALAKLDEPTPLALEEIKELERRMKKISRLAVWIGVKEKLAAIIPRGHGHGPEPRIEKSEYPKVIEAVERLGAEHRQWKQEAIYGEVGRIYDRSWRTIQEVYLEAKRLQGVQTEQPPG